MKLVWERWLVLLLACLAASSAAGQAPVVPSVPGAPNSGLGTNVPPLPSLKSPVDIFRELFAMAPSERKQALASRPPEMQKQIFAKIREYESLNANERELRLRSTDLRYYLLPLMETPATNRTAQLALIPSHTRGLVSNRIAAWDQLSPEVQRGLLDNEATLRFFSESAARDEQQQWRSLENISPARREKLEAGLARWRALSPEERRNVFSRFEQFFELNARERQAALRTLSEAERQQIERTLASFGKLPSAQRAECIRSLRRYAELSLEERQQFLKNAERWKLMTPEQRQSWRDLVARLSSLPPLPPGIASSFPPLPPPNRLLMTNGN